MFSPEHSPPVLTPAPSSGSSIGVVGGHSDHNWSVFPSGNELVIQDNLILIHDNARHWGDFMMHVATLGGYAQRGLQ